MAGRKKKTGIEFSGWDVDVFEDSKIEQLIDTKGLTAFLVFFCVCQRIYATNGYFMPWKTENAPSIKKMLGGEIDSRYIVSVVDACLDIGLFAADIYMTYGVLTSKAIQRNFAVVLPKRRRKEVAAEYWIIPESESYGAMPIPLAETE